MIILDTHVWLWCEIAVLSTRLRGEFHGDTADRLIVASSLSH